jgi:hypothetical protein
MTSPIRVIAVNRADKRLTRPATAFVAVAIFYATGLV